MAGEQYNVTKVIRNGDEYYFPGAGKVISKKIFGTGEDGDCVIEYDASIRGNVFMEAKEYNFNNFTVCPNVKLRFCGDGIPVIRVKECFCNSGTIWLRNPLLTTCPSMVERNSGFQLCGDCNPNYGSANILKIQLTIPRLECVLVAKGGTAYCNGNGGDGGNLCIAAKNGCVGNWGTCAAGVAGTSSYADAAGGGGGGRNANYEGCNGCNATGIGCGGDGAYGNHGGGGGGGFGCLKAGKGGDASEYGNGGQGGNSIYGDGGKGGNSSCCNYAPGCGGCSYYGNGGNAGNAVGSNSRSNICGGCSIFGKGGDSYQAGSVGGDSLYGAGGCAPGRCGSGISGYVAWGGIYDMGIFGKNVCNSGTILGCGNKGTNSGGTRGANIYIVHQGFSSSGIIDINGNGCPNGQIIQCLI